MKKLPIKIKFTLCIYLIIIFLLLFGFIFYSINESLISTWNNCNQETNCISSNCTIRYCQYGSCESFQIQGCTENNVNISNPTANYQFNSICANQISYCNDTNYNVTSNANIFTNNNYYYDDKYTDIKKVSINGSIKLSDNSNFLFNNNDLLFKLYSPYIIMTNFTKKIDICNKIYEANLFIFRDIYSDFCIYVYIKINLIFQI
jgi:hypothetical protein